RGVALRREPRRRGARLLDVGALEIGAQPFEVPRPGAPDCRRQRQPQTGHPHPPAHFHGVSQVPEGVKNYLVFSGAPSLVSSSLKSTVPLYFFASPCRTK